MLALVLAAMLPLSAIFANDENNNETFTAESEEQLVDDAKLRLIVTRILDLEQQAINKNFNDDETKKKIMKIIEEELKCY